MPFCATRCDFCAFYEEQPSRDQVDAFLGAMEREFALGPVCPVPGGEVAVFIGGGTPSLLPARDLGRLGSLVTAWLGAVPFEWTVEMAPSTVKADKLAALREAGVTRASLGVQSFSDEWLEKLGRRQSIAQAERAWRLIREAGFPSTNLDLMFALPGQTPEQWRTELQTAASWAPDHISTYCLTPEEDTALWAKMAAGKHRRDEEQEASLYRQTWAWLDAHGWEQYEVSNFARSGHACAHNLNVWAMGDWLGVGPGAASQFRGWRASNPADLRLWQEALIRRASGEFPAQGHEQRVALDDATLAADALIFGLRLTAGVDLKGLRKRFPDFSWSKLEAQAERWFSAGLASRVGDRLQLTVEGRLRADAVGLDVLEVD